MLKKASPDRIKELLGVLNYMCAPFGSAEKLLATYGTRGGDYSMDASGNPVPTTSGANSYNAHPLPFTFIAQGPTVIYSPINSRDFATIQYAADQAELAAGVLDPTNGLYSASNSSLGPSLHQGIVGRDQRYGDGAPANVQFTAILATWQNNGGNKTREEYQAALSAA